MKLRRTKIVPIFWATLYSPYTVLCIYVIVHPIAQKPLAVSPLAVSHSSDFCRAGSIITFAQDILPLPARRTEPRRDNNGQRHTDNH